MLRTSCHRSGASRAVLVALGLVSLGLVSLGLSTRIARAQTPDPEALFRQGVQAARDGRWPDALDAFARSYELSPRALTLMNLAGAQARTGRLLEATEGYRRFLVEATDERTRGYREPVARALREVETRTPRVRLEIAGVLPTDRIQIGDRSYLGNQTLAELPINPGEHRVVVRRGEPALVVGRAQFSIAEGQRTRVSVPLGPPEPEPPATPTVAPTAPQPPVVPSPRRVAQQDQRTHAPALPVRRDDDDRGGGSVLASPVFWVVVGIVVAGGATAGILLATSGGAADPIPGNTTPGVIEVE